MLSKFLRFGLAGVLTSTLLSGCSPAPVESSVPPTPSVSSATPVDPYAEAERVYRRVEQINASNLLIGKYDPFPEELYELLMEPYLSVAKEDYAESAKYGVAMYGLETITYEIQPFHDDIGAGAHVVIHSCTDYRGVRITHHGEEVGEGELLYERAFFKYDNDKLKLFYIGSEEASECTLQ